MFSKYPPISLGVIAAILSLLFLPGCSATNYSENGKLVTNATTTSTSLPSMLSTGTPYIPKNFILSPKPDAAKLPIDYYKYLTQKNYSKAISLWAPHPREVYGSPGARKYLENIEHVQFIHFEDVTKNWGYIPLSFDQYYAVKVYIGVMRFKTKEPSLVPGLEGVNVHRFFIIKSTKDSPWEMFMEQGIPKEYASKQWGINLSSLN